MQVISYTIEVFLLLILLDVTVCEKETGKTPLHFACASQDEILVKALLIGGADSTSNTFFCKYC